MKLTRGKPIVGKQIVTRSLEEMYLKMDKMMLVDLETKQSFTTYHLPCGNIKIADNEFHDYYTFFPNELMQTIDTDDIATLAQGKDWLLRMRDKYPHIPAIYHEVSNHFSALKEYSEQQENLRLFKENCSPSPFHLHQEMMEAMRIKRKDSGERDEEVLLAYFPEDRDLHRRFPTRKYFFKEEVVDMIGLFFIDHAMRKEFDLAQQYIDTMDKVFANDPEGIKITNRWDLVLRSQKITKTQKYLTISLLVLAIVAVVGGIGWLIYKFFAWIF